MGIKAKNVITEHVKLYPNPSVAQHRLLIEEVGGKDVVTSPFLGQLVIMQSQI